MTTIRREIISDKGKKILIRWPSNNLTYTTTNNKNIIGGKMSHIFFLVLLYSLIRGIGIAENIDARNNKNITFLD